MIKNIIDNRSNQYASKNIKAIFLDANSEEKISEHNNVSLQDAVEAVNEEKKDIILQLEDAE